MNRRTCACVSFFWVAAIVAASGCSASEDRESAPLGADPNPGAGGLIMNGDGIVIGSGTGGAPPIIIPETETRPFRPPVITGDYLWSANPRSGKVALIHAPTLATRVLSAGLEPTVLAAVPDASADAAAIVINEGTSDSSYFRVEGSNITTKRIAIHVGANRWSISPSGRYAVAWSSSDNGLDPTNGLQEISLIDLSRSKPVAERLGIGFRPLDVTYNEEESQVIVTAQTGISLVTLENNKVSWIPLSFADGRDVSITRDGGHAFVRSEGKSTVEIVALDGSDERTLLDLPGPPTDLDLSPTGRAVAVLREQEMIATFLVEEILSDPAAFETLSLPGQVIGSAELAADGLTVVLYSNAIENSLVSVVHFDERDAFLTYSTFDTQTAVETVCVSPDGHHAIVKARGIAGSNAGAFTILTLDEPRFPRVLGTHAPIQQIDLHNDFGLVTTSTQGLHEAHLISLDALRVDVIPLASAPSSAGILPSLRVGFAAQEHPEGRVTFFDFAALEAHTLTGFELSSKAVQE